MGPQGFHEFKTRVFVETGTFGGDGIQKALDAGFEEVYSIDIDAINVRDSKNRFKDKPEVHIYLGDSSYQLTDVIAPLNEPVVFWLDAHNGFPDPEDRTTKNTPLMEELDQIKNHPIKTHTILIDDLHCCETLLFDFLTLEEIMDKVWQINPDYTITFVDGGNDGEYKNNVLVAYVKEELSQP